MIAIRWVLSLFFNIQMYFMMMVIGIAFFPFAIFSKKMARFACVLFCRWSVMTARVICGLKTEVRGTPPTGAVMVASKHHSFFDIIVIFAVTPHARFILKRELLFTPFLGQYGLRIGCIPVARGQRGKALTKMRMDVAKGRDEPGQLIIYPQGTRVAVDDFIPYKIGTGVLYRELGQPCVPVATNIGLFWPKRAIMRKPGTAIVEFLPMIPEGLPIEVFMQKLEDAIEPNSNRLLAESGFIQPPRYYAKHEQIKNNLEKRKKTTDFA